VYKPGEPGVKPLYRIRHTPYFRVQACVVGQPLLQPSQQVSFDDTRGAAVPPPNVPDGSTLPRHTPLPSETQAPGEIEIVLYWVVGEELQPEYRHIPWRSRAAVSSAVLPGVVLVRLRSGFAAGAEVPGSWWFFATRPASQVRGAAACTR
jgi:hypothetical protein